MKSSPPVDTPAARQRIDFIDAMRGIAVGLMVWLHTADGWLRPDLKYSPAWDWIRSAGGLAAPAFFLLAGIGVGLEWGRPATDLGKQRASGVARGLQLMVLGYALRLQMWMIDAGGIASLRAWTAAIPLGLGYFALYRALALRGQPSARRKAWLGIGATVIGLGLVAWWTPARLRPLLRVDVLQGLGASLALVAVLGPWLRRAVWRPIALSVLVAVATPWVRSHVPGPLPAAIAGYLASWEAGTGVSAPTLFPLFPWFAYVPVGVVAGMALGPLTRTAAERRMLLWSAFGAGLSLLCCEPLPLARWLLEEWPWLIQFIRVGYRVGIVFMLGAVALGLGHRSLRLVGPWVVMGRASLFVYWVHLQLAFGALSRPLSKRLELSSWLLGFVLLMVLMAVLSRLWLGVRRHFAPSIGQVAEGTGPAHA